MSEFQGVDTRPLVAVSPAFEAMTGSWGGIGLGKMDRLGMIWVFPKMVGFPSQIIHFNRVFHYKPSILGYPYFWKHPFVVLF